jgi:hypothetical protein
MNTFGLIVVFFIMIYGLCWMVGGSRAANGFARHTGRAAQRGVEHIGRTSGRAAMTYPLIAGIILILILANKCGAF